MTPVIAMGRRHEAQRSDLNSHYGPAHIPVRHLARSRRRRGGRAGSGATAPASPPPFAPSSASSRSVRGASCSKAGCLGAANPCHRARRPRLCAGRTPHLHGFDGRGNLEVGRQPVRPNAPHWTRDKLFALFPNLGEMRGRQGGRMSGGEQQMLTIARTLMGNPSLVLLDEPSEGLSPKIVEQMVEAILTMKKEGVSIVVSEQNLHFARLISIAPTSSSAAASASAEPWANSTPRPDIRDAHLAL